MTVHESKQTLQKSVDRVKRILERTPEERLLWSPAPAARTPLAQVVHVATVIQHIHAMMMGNRFPYRTGEEADAEFRTFEKSITRREDALSLLEKHSTALIEWLDQLPAESLSVVVPLPFDREGPLELLLGGPAKHTNDHAAQMDYIQTCYDDRAWT